MKMMSKLLNNRKNKETNKELLNKLFFMLKNGDKLIKL